MPYLAEPAARTLPTPIAVLKANFRSNLAGFGFDVEAPERDSRLICWINLREGGTSRARTVKFIHAVGAVIDAEQSTSTRLAVAIAPKVSA
jgi:hypothetical protein